VSNRANISVAVVDDDISVCRSLSRLLRVQGIEAVTYPSAEAFIADVGRPRFDCLLLDVQLGGMSGIELHELLASGGSPVPVIFLTAHDDPEIRERAVRAHCADFLQKTEPAETVLRSIRSAVAR